jgi:hypothetical protein
MSAIEKILELMQAAPQNVRFADLAKVCGHYFGQARQQGTSHAVYKTPWLGDPRVNIQCGGKGMAKAYLVRQVLAAIEMLKESAE